MNNNLRGAVTDLVKREPPKVVAATGIFFHALAKQFPQQRLELVLGSHRSGVWGNETAEGCGYPVLRSTNMRKSRADFSDVAWREIPAKQAVGCALQTGDILVTKSSGSSDLVGKSVLFVHPGDSRTYLFSNFTHRLRPNQKIVVPSYLAWFLRSPQALGWRYEAQQNAVGLRNLQISEFLAQLIPVPPLSIQHSIALYLEGLEYGGAQAQLPLEFTEQRRIVTRIEELATKIEEARTLRQQATVEADTLYNAVLRSSFGTLLARHATTRLEQLIVEAGYGTSDKCYPERAEAAIPVLRIPNVASERISFDDLKYAQLSQHDQGRLLLKQGDILVVRTNGSLDLVGRSAVVKELREPMAFASYMIRLRLDQDHILPDYAQRMLRHLRTSGDLVDFARTTAGQYNVSLGRLRSAEIPVPSLSQQRRVVAELDTLQLKVNTLKELQAETTAELDAMLPSILDKAFKRAL
jgi:type I restriction enzyme S subunit